MQRIGAVGVAKTGIRRLAAATLLVHGSDMQKEKFLRRSLTGEDTWCQLFSEPGSGSDLAGATTRAEFKGNRWVINGQKVWTTSAHHADWGLLLARTDSNVPKHQGLSYFVLDIRQPGVEVHPLRQMNGYASFNQVFFTDAEVPPEMLVSEVGRGWAVATTTLMHERRGADGMRTWGMSSERAGRIYDEERAENATVMEPYKWYPQRAGRVDLVLERAKATGRAERSGGAAGDREAADDVEGGGVDRAARSGRADAGSAAGAGGVFGEARLQPRGARGGSGSHADQRGGCDADRRGRADGGADRGDPCQRAGGVDRRRDRRDPAQHHLGAGAGDAEGAADGQ